jgi:hypothetical protein
MRRGRVQSMKTTGADLAAARREPDRGPGEP